MSAKPCDNCTMIIVNYMDLWLVHSHVARLLDGARLELRWLKAHSTLLGACTSCPMLRSNLEASTVEIKDLKYKLDHASHYSVLSPPCELCGSLKGKFFHAIKENTELQQEVAYLTARLEKTILSEKMVEDDLSRVEESATKSTYKLCVDFERCEDKGEKSAPKFIPSSTYLPRGENNQIHQSSLPIQPKAFLQP
jgi:predicted Zn-ribbon and HTH transcriptional regulator